MSILGRRAMFLMPIAGLALGVVIGPPLGGLLEGAPAGPPVSVAPVSMQPQATVGPDFRGVVKSVIPSVVTVRSRKVIEITRAPFMLPYPFQRFFGDDFRRPDRRGPETEKRFQYGLGSGVIVSDDGLILTNNHVIEDSSEIEVVLSDGTAIPVEPGSAAQRAGLRRGDLIQEVNREKVTSVTGFRDALGSSSSSVTLFLVRRGDDTFYATVKRR